MKRRLYGERDYAFGQRILTLRTQIGLGQAGLGQLLHVQSALVARVMRAVAEYFDVVFFRSLRDAPACSTLLDDCLQVLPHGKGLSQAKRVEVRCHLMYTDFPCACLYTYE